MSKQYPKIRALRPPTVALFFVVSVEALAHLIFPSLFPWQSAIAAITLSVSIDGILVVDECGHIVFANKQFGLPFGISDDPYV